jgi:hypothetical protein
VPITLPVQNGDESLLLERIVVALKLVASISLLTASIARLSPMPRKQNQKRVFATLLVAA